MFSIHINKHIYVKWAWASPRCVKMVRKEAGIGSSKWRTKNFEQFKKGDLRFKNEKNIGLALIYPFKKRVGWCDLSKVWDNKFYYTPWKLTVLPLKINGWKMKCPSGMAYFQGRAVSFREGLWKYQVDGVVSWIYIPQPRMLARHHQDDMTFF